MTPPLSAPRADFDDLEDFQRTTFSADGKSRLVFRKGEGPAVLVISEVPGITPKVAAFARRVADRGFTVVMPHLFGEPGRPFDPVYALQSLIPLCISSEFTAFAVGRTTPIVSWLRALSWSEFEKCGGPGVGVVGMCITGNFALGMMVDDHVLAPVLSQPSLPIALTPAARSDVALSDEDMARVKQRCADDDVCVLGLRFTGDMAVPKERFGRLRRELGDNFIGVEINSKPGNPDGIPFMAHSVLTEHLVDEPGHPTHDALEQVLGFFKQRLAS